MSLKIGSNISSLQANRILGNTSNELNSIYEKLSSGLRINKASDDPAGLAIATSLASNKKVFTQGIRNFNDGVSALSIAESAVDQASSIAIRIRELATQSANGSYNTSQRTAIDSEAQALKKEFLRIAQSTKFNSLGLLDGSLQELKLQGSYGTDGSITANTGGTIGTGTFNTAVNFSTAGASDNSLSSADLNSDGFADIVTADSVAGVISVMYGNSSGSFSAAKTFSAGGMSYGVTIADFNSDNILDIASASTSSINILLGSANGSFAMTSSYSNTGLPQFISNGDFNGDGNIDLVSADVTSATVSVFLGTGNGTFGARSSFAVGTSPQTVIVADFNNDGKADLVSADSGTNTLSVLLGNGTGSFATRVSYSVGASTRSVTSGDFNGDGKLDLITHSGTSISFLSGTGTGTFNSAITSAVGSGIYSLVNGDFNGDGQSDIAATNGSGTVYILTGNGSGSFSLNASYAVSSDSLRIISNDFNGDGVLDLATSSWDTDLFSALIGKTKLGMGPLLDFDLKTKDGAKQAISFLDRKITQLSQQRATIGAHQNRLSFALNDLEAKTDVYGIAESRIKDADVASESSSLIRLQIVQQSAIAVLAQANQRPQIALQLLVDSPN